MTISDVQNKTVKSLDKLRKPTSVANMTTEDQLMHEYLVLDTVRAYVEKQRKAVLDNLRVYVDNAALTKAIAEVMKTGVKREITVVTGQVYELECEVKSASTSLDKEKLLEYLRVNKNWSVVEIEFMLKACSKRGKNPESYSVKDL